MPGMVWHDDCADAAETVAACWQDWERRWRHARFRKYVTANGFGIVILIAAASRATAIRSELRKQRWPRCVRPSVQVLRELEHIAAGAKIQMSESVKARTGLVPVERWGRLSSLRR